MTFNEKLLKAARRNDSWVCVGLDPRPDHMPDAFKHASIEEGIEAFLGHVVESTADLVCAYKPNAAFFEQLGSGGHQLLERVMDAIPGDVPVILDAKRGDIGSTGEAYARWAFERLDADAITAHPYMGWDSVEPFARHRDRGVFVLVRTTNAGARDFQDLQVDGEPLYERVARKVAAWRDDGYGNLGAVAGATYPEELARVRSILGEDAPLLIPGVGAQGASGGEAVRKGANAAGEMGVVSASRSVLHAEDPREACADLRDAVNAARGGDA